MKRQSRTSDFAGGTILALLLLTGCADRRLPLSPPPIAASNSDYVDLQAGWRLRVVTPLGKSGDYRLRYRDVAASGNTLTLATDEFAGYELAHYEVEAQGGNRGVRIRLVSAEVIRGDVPAVQSRSIVPLFSLPRRTRFVRLVFLARVSASDHNMAVVACENPEDLAAFTRAAQRNDPSCGKDPRCSWIPPGIAVRPERKRSGSDGWESAR